MDAKQVLRADFERARMITHMLLGDLSDQDLLQRTTPNANHVAWQLGHLIGSEHQMAEMIRAGSMPALPEGFKDGYTKETAASDDAGAFLTKDEYLRLMDEQRQGLLALLDSLTEEELLAETPESWRQLAPRNAEVLGLMAAHEVMHSGQITSLRRMLGKPVVF